MNAAVKDIRGTLAAVVVVLAMIGFLALALKGQTEDGLTLLTMMGLPALTFILGLGSEPVEAPTARVEE